MNRTCTVKHHQGRTTYQHKSLTKQIKRKTMPQSNLQKSQKIVDCTNEVQKSIRKATTNIKLNWIEKERSNAILGLVNM